MRTEPIYIPIPIYIYIYILIGFRFGYALVIVWFRFGFILVTFWAPSLLAIFELAIVRIYLWFQGIEERSGASGKIVGNDSIETIIKQCIVEL